MTDDSHKPVPVQIDGNVVGTLLDVFRDGDELIEQLRRRAARIGASYGIIDEFSGLGEGSTTKYLSAARSRQLTLSSLLKIASVLGLKALFVIDEAQTRKMQRQWTNRDERRVRTQRRVPIGAITVRRFLPVIAAEMGRRGGIATNAKLSPELRSEAARRAVRARWNRKRS
jgi:hypothetical protein